MYLLPFFRISLIPKILIDLVFTWWCPTMTNSWCKRTTMEIREITFSFLRYPWHWLASHCNLCILNVYFMCTFNITLCCFIQMLICDTDKNQSTTISEQTAAEVTWGQGVNFFYWSNICNRFCYCQNLSNVSAQ